MAKVELQEVEQNRAMFWFGGLHLQYYIVRVHFANCSHPYPDLSTGRGQITSPPKARHHGPLDPGRTLSLPRLHWLAGHEKDRAKEKAVKTIDARRPERDNRPQCTVPLLSRRIQLVCGFGAIQEER